MRRILANAHVSLDGVVQAPGGPEEDPRNGFAHGGWTAPYGDDRSSGLLIAGMAEPFDLLLGRRTYEIFAAYWPHVGANPIGERFNAATKYVVTRSLDHLDWENSERIRVDTGGDVAQAIARLKSGNGPDLHVWGSSELLHALTAAGLIDEFRLWIYPVVLGYGRRLFERDVPAHTLTLVDTKTTSTGVMFNTYRPAGPLEAGSFARETPSDAELARRRKLASEDPGALSS